MLSVRGPTISRSIDTLGTIGDSIDSIKSIDLSLDGSTETSRHELLQYPELSMLSPIIAIDSQGTIDDSSRSIAS